MPDDPLVRLHDDGYALQRRLEREYADARRDPAAWQIQRQELILGWRRSATEWAATVEKVLADAKDTRLLARFHNAPASSSAAHGVNVEWSRIHDYLVARLRVLEAIAEAPSRIAPPTINIAGSVGVVNLGTILGDARGSVTHLQDSGQTELANVLRQLIETLPATQLSVDEKGEVAELTKALADEASKPGRLSTLGRVAGQALGAILTRSAELGQIWESLKSYLS